jgi:chromosome segregation ATPase
MMPRRASSAQEADLYPSDTDPAVLGTLARAAEANAAKQGDDEKMHIFWRVFGGAIASIVALVGITLYNNLHSNIAELRAEITKMQESRADLVRKDEFNNRISSNYDRLVNVQAQASTQAATLSGLKTELDAAKEKLGKAVTETDAMKKDVAAIDALKEKLTAVQADLKAIRDEAVKVKTDIEKNQSADQERKARRDEQAKEFEKLLKETGAAVQDCQLKLARLEGQQAVKPAEPKAKEMPKE